MQGNRRVLTLYIHRCEKNGEHSWHKEWANSNPGNIQRGSCKKQRDFLFCDNAGYAKQKIVLSKDSAWAAEDEPEVERIPEHAEN